MGNKASPTFADIDGDGDQDLVVGEYDGSFNYFLNESTTDSITFTEKTGTENPFNGFSIASFSAPTFTDIDGDGDLDLIGGNNSGEIFIFFNYFGNWVPFL